MSDILYTTLHIYEMNRILIIVVLSIIFAFSALADNWVASWACAPQEAGKNDLPHGDALSGSAVRQIIHMSLSGDSIRLKLSNQHSQDSLIIKSVYISNTDGGSDIDKSSVKWLTFNGKRNVSLPWNGTVVSDAIAYKTDPLQLLSITINYGNVPQVPTIHGGSRTTTYIISQEADENADFSSGKQEVHWYSIVGIDVYRNDSPKCIAILGNSITDGRGSTTDGQDRWTDVLAENLNGEIGVLNLGIGGNCVVNGGIGITGKSRFNRDILSQNGITHVIIFEGINDLGSIRASQETVDNLIKAYQSFIRKAHKHGLKIYGATITPMYGSDYYSEERDAYRRKVNDWIKNSGEFDGVFDIDSIVANPSDRRELNPEYQFDTLHPNATGYRAIGEYVANELKSML